MPLTITQKTDSDWLVQMPDEMAQAYGVAAGSFVLLRTEAGTLSAEIVPPLAPDLEDFVQRFCEKNKEAFAELKRLGD